MWTSVGPSRISSLPVRMARCTRVRLGRVRDDPEAVVQGVKALLTQADIAGEHIGRVVHGTTLATNLLVEGKGAAVAVATTRGFPDLARSRR